MGAWPSGITCAPSWKSLFQTDKALKRTSSLCLEHPFDEAAPCEARKGVHCTTRGERSNRSQVHWSNFSWTCSRAPAGREEQAASNNLSRVVCYQEFQVTATSKLLLQGASTGHQAMHNGSSDPVLPRSQHQWINRTTCPSSSEPHNGQPSVHPRRRGRSADEAADI